MSKKDVKLVLSLCYRWGYSYKISDLKGLLELTLGNKYKLDLVEEPIRPGNGEYLIFLEKNGKKKLIFSNSKSDKNKGAVFGYELAEDNIEDFVSLLDKSA